MADRTRRKELLAQYKENPPDAGVYRIINGANGRMLLGSALNLESVRSKLEFARTTGTGGTFFRAIAADMRAHGITAFTFEILDVLEAEPGATREEITRDLAALEALWREKYDPALLY